MLRQREFQLGQEQFLIGVRLGIAGQDQDTAVGGRHMHIDHLHRGELLQHRARGQPRSQGLEPLLQGDLQAIGDEGDEDVGLDAIVGLVVDGADRQIAFQLLEGLLDLGELNVVAPQCGGILAGEIGAQQVAAFAPTDLSQLVLVQGEGEGSGVTSWPGSGRRIATRD